MPTSLQDQLLATPVAYKALHEETKTEKPRKLPPRLHAGQLVPGEKRSALLLAHGKLGPSSVPEGPLLTMKSVFGRKYKTA